MNVSDKNICLIVYSHYSRDARVRRYAECLARNGYFIDVICLGENYTPKEPNIHLIHFPFDRKRYGKMWYLIEYSSFFLFSFYTLTKNFLLKRYKFIHINNMPDILVFTVLFRKYLVA